MAQAKKDEVELLTMELFQASQVNEVKIGGTVDNLTSREGGIKNEETGEKWADSYYADFSFKGGMTSVRIDMDTYHSLKIGSTYQYIGRVAMKSPKGNGQPYPTIDFIRFDFLF